MATPRPVQATIAGWLVVGGSVAAVVTAFSSAAASHSLDTRRSVERYLDGSGVGHGIGVEDALTVLRVASTVTAVCAAVTAVLGWYVLHRSRGSRTALTVMSVPLFLAALVSGDLAGAVVAAAAVMLWLQPSRAWLDGVAPPRRTVPVSPGAPAGPPSAGPPPWPPPPTPTSTSYDRDVLTRLPPPTAAPVYPAPLGAPTGPTSDVRPAAVVWTCVLTWVVAAFFLLVFGEALVSMLTDSQRVLDQAHQQNPDLAAQGVSDTTLRAAIYVTTGIGLAWALVAAGFAVLAWRRVRWAATGLLVSTLLAGGLGLLLLRAEVRRWYAARPGGGG